MARRVGAGGYGIDLRERVVNAVLDGESREAVAERFGVSLKTIGIYMIKSRIGTLGKTRKPTGRPRHVTPEIEEVLLEKWGEKRDATLKELRDALFKATGMKVSESTVCRVMLRNGITFKKRSSPLSEMKRYGNSSAEISKSF